MHQFSLEFLKGSAFYTFFFKPDQVAHIFTYIFVGATLATFAATSSPALPQIQKSTVFFSLPHPIFTPKHPLVCKNTAPRVVSMTALKPPSA